MTRNVPDFNLGLNASGSFAQGVGIANEIIANRLRQQQQNQNYDIQNRQVQLQEQEAQQKQAFQRLATEAFEKPEIVLPQLYARDPVAAARISEGIQQRYSSQYNTLNLLTKDTKAENKQATYDLLKPELQRQFPELEFGDNWSSDLQRSLASKASAIKSKMKMNLEFRDTAQGIVGFDPATGESVQTGVGSRPYATGGAGGGATGELVRQVMQDNPGMSFTEALYFVQTGARQGTRLEDGKVAPIAGVIPAKQDIEGGKKLAEKLGEKQAEGLDELRVQAEDAANNLQNIKYSRELLDKGAITGFGANFKLGFGKALQAAGVNVAEDAVANTETYAANAAKQVATYIKAFGSGTGLSDADRTYATKMAAGDITLNETSMRKILDLNEKAANNIIKKYSGRRENLNENLKAYLPDVKKESNANKQTSGFKFLGFE